MKERNTVVGNTKIKRNTDGSLTVTTIHRVAVTDEEAARQLEHKHKRAPFFERLHAALAELPLFWDWRRFWCNLWHHTWYFDRVGDTAGYFCPSCNRFHPFTVNPDGYYIPKRKVQHDY